MTETEITPESLARARARQMIRGSFLADPVKYAEVVALCAKIGQDNCPPLMTDAQVDKFVDDNWRDYL